MRVFVSGHLTVAAEEFADHYIPRLEQHLHNGDTFVIGDARGVDTLAQEFLSKRGAQVTVFHMFQTPRQNAGNFPVVGGFGSDDERDAAMTAASDIDIAWVRPGREDSGTARNIARRPKPTNDSLGQM